MAPLARLNTTTNTASTPAAMPTGGSRIGSGLITAPATSGGWSLEQEFSDKVSFARPSGKAATTQYWITPADVSLEEFDAVVGNIAKQPVDALDDYATTCDFGLAGNQCTATFTIIFAGALGEQDVEIHMGHDPNIDGNKAVFISATKA